MFQAIGSLYVLACLLCLFIWVLYFIYQMFIKEFDLKLVIIWINKTIWLPGVCCVMTKDVDSVDSLLMN